MNLPNTLTVLRLFLAPVFFVIYMIPEWSGADPESALVLISTWMLVVVYLLIESTDLADGIIARKMNLVTDLGKVLDPFADVISRLTYFICLAHSGIMPMWVLLVIVYREFSVTFLRMIMMGKGVAMAANLWGKTKAVLYAVSAIAGIAFVVIVRLFPDIPIPRIIPNLLLVLFILTAIASIASFLTYVAAIRKR